MIAITLYIVTGAAIGFLIGLTGVGGGVLAVPVLVLLVGLQPITAVGTASLYAVLTKIYALIKHYRQGTANLRIGARFLAAALPGVVCTAVLVKLGEASLAPAGVQSLQNTISYLIIGCIGFALVALLLDYRKFEHNFYSSGLGRAMGLVCSFLVGAVMGATSIGGGILIIPALLLFYRETSKYVGTSIFVAVFSMVVMSAIYAFLGDGHFGDGDTSAIGHFGDDDTSATDILAMG